MPPATRYARSGETNIAFQVIGHGAIDLVLGLGWISNVDAFWEEPRFTRFVERLSSFARVIIYDKRGTGLSDSVPLDQTHELEPRLDDIRAVMDAAGSRQAALFDISAGGAIATLFAAMHPDRTSKLIIFGGFARRQWSDDYPWGRTIEVESDLLKQPWGSLADPGTSVPSAAGDPAFETWWASYLRRSAGPGTARVLARLNTRIDIRDQLPRVAAPALVLHRRGDRVVTLANGQYLAEHIPNATLRELPGDDHLPFIGDQEQILAEIEQFLTGAHRDSEPNLTLTTILATEIVAAAETAVRLGDRRWSELWSEQRSLARTLISRHAGREISPTLEGSVAIFPQPANALACARDVIEGTRRVGLHARAGLHMGEVITAGTEVTGVAVLIAARIAEQAGPNDVLVSGPLYDLSAGMSTQLEHIGSQAFAGLPGEWRLYRLVQHGTAVVVPTVPNDAALARPIATLSRREREIAGLLALGLANRQIADELVITVATVERHVANILIKLGFRSRAHVAAWAVEQGLLQTPAGEGLTTR